ncbi:MAG: AraC family transcriptional regulator [Actinomycetia bacterium]|nr:AraC family transcriptional regulator [Actinomycetes bacterium]
MQWHERMNDAIDYLEDHLDTDLSIEKAARIALTTPYQFQRLFSHMAGVPLSVYLRQRRLTKAAFDLQNGEKVIEVAMRYGYQSPTAFNRAFQALHGISPSTAQKPDISLKAFPRISFHVTIEGVIEMEYRIVSKKPMRVVGVREPLSQDVEESFKSVPLFWEKTTKEGMIPQILALAEGDPKGLLGVSTCNEPDQNYYYIAAVSEKPAPEGMDELIIPQSTWAVFSGAGDSSSVQALQKRIFSEWLPTSGYEWANAPDIEVYYNDDPTHMAYEVWLPIKKA